MKDRDDPKSRTVGKRHSLMTTTTHGLVTSFLTDDLMFTGWVCFGVRVPAFLVALAERLKRFPDP
jgi:hypothetical protein